MDDYDDAPEIAALRGSMLGGEGDVMERMDKELGITPEGEGITDASSEFLHPDDYDAAIEAQMGTFLGMREPPDGDYLGATMNLLLACLQKGDIAATPHLYEGMDRMKQRDEEEAKKKQEDLDNAVDAIDPEKQTRLSPSDARRRHSRR